MAYRIEKIVCDGFRGCRKKIEFEFEQGLVILCGPQRSGKSSVLNAPVWALIGSDAAKVNVGPVQIRERASWLAENMEARDCLVEINLRETDGGTLTIERRKGRDNYKIQHDGREINENPLTALRLTLDGLVSSVFLPQEVIRAALSVEPRHRRAIFTQLAGLEDLRALEECFKNSSDTLKKSLDQIVQRRASIDMLIQAQVASQKERIRELLEKMRSLSLSVEDISPDWAKDLAKQSIVALTGFCKKYELEVPMYPDVTSPDDLPGFVEKIRATLSKFEAQCPETDQQNRLYRRKHEIEGFITAQQEIERKRKENDSKRQMITDDHGTGEDLKFAIEKHEMELEKVNAEIDRAGKYQTMIQEALTYFEDLPEATTEIDCPVCRKTGVSVAHVRDHLLAEIERAGLEPLRRSKNEIALNLKKEREAQGQLLQLVEQDNQLEQKQQELVQKISEFRDRPLEPHESIERVLSGMEEDVDNRLKELKDLLEKRGEAILNVRTELDKLSVAGELHSERQRLARLDEIPNTPEYHALIEIETKAELQMGFLSELERGIKEEVEQAFIKKFAALKDEVNVLYRKFIDREDFPKIWIDAGNWEVLAGADGEGTGITRVFNVGDMTAVALSLFLASASRANHDAGFILLDDPTQNLDEEHEARLAKILAELAEHRQVVISSSRTSFIKILEATGTVKRQIIRLAPWDKDRSCRLQEDIIGS